MTQRDTLPVAKAAASDGQKPWLREVLVKNSAVRVAAPWVALGLVAIWSIILNFLGQDFIHFGVQTFFFLLILCDLLLAAKLVRPLPARPSKPTQIAICIVAAIAMLPFVQHHWETFNRVYHAPPNSDLTLNTWTAAHNTFDLKLNPYTTRNQLWHDPSDAAHVTKVGKQLYMFGVPYDFGYPYFPAMLLTYEPFRHIEPSMSYIRMANAVFMLATFIAIAWLTTLLVPVGWKAVGATLAVASFMCTWVLGWEFFGLGTTDVIIPMFILYGFIAVYYQRPTVAGLLFGWSLACKLMPGAFICLIMAAWFWRRRDRWQFLIPMLGIFAVVVVPFIIANPPAFLSATVLFYLTEHAHGDDSSLYFFLPTAVQPIFISSGYFLVLVILARTVLKKSLTLIGALASCFVSVVLFIAFSKMNHDNYLFAILPLGSVVLIGYALQRVGNQAVLRLSEQEPASASVSA